MSGISYQVASMASEHLVAHAPIEEVNHSQVQAFARDIQDAISFMQDPEGKDIGSSERSTQLMELLDVLCYESTYEIEHGTPTIKVNLDGTEYHIRESHSDGLLISEGYDHKHSVSIVNMTMDDFESLLDTYDDEAILRSELEDAYRNVLNDNTPIEPLNIEPDRINIKKKTPNKPSIAEEERAAAKPSPEKHEVPLPGRRLPPLAPRPLPQLKETTIRPLPEQALPPIASKAPSKAMRPNAAATPLSQPSSPSRKAAEYQPASAQRASEAKNIAQPALPQANVAHQPQVEQKQPEKGTGIKQFFSSLINWLLNIFKSDSSSQANGKPAVINRPAAKIAAEPANNKARKVESEQIDPEEEGIFMRLHEQYRAVLRAPTARDKLYTDDD